MNDARPATHDLMACLGEESRFRLVQALIGGARCVTDLAAAVGLSQSCTTRHLQVLERRRLVTGKRDGKRVLYRIREDDPGLMPLLGWALSDPGFRTRLARRSGGSSPRRAAATSSPGRHGHGAGPAADPPLPGPPHGPPPVAVDGPVPGTAPQKAVPEARRPDPESAPEPAGRARLMASEIEDYLL
jgi:DNA-binding transcriptional ArsR family regulator